MPWREQDRMGLRAEVCAMVRQGALPVSEVANRYGVSRKTVYKWLQREAAGESLADQSRRPHTTPRQTPPEIEAVVLAVRDRYPTWGSRKLRVVVEREQGLMIPPTTIDRILRRSGRIDPQARLEHRPLRRFERSAPNELLQLDFTGHFPLERGRCHPLPLLDDHSRFLLGLVACANEQRGGVEAMLTAIFERYGVPDAILCDHGPPWGTKQGRLGLTRLSVWLMKQDIAVIHGRPRHPQTQGKLERFNRTLNAEVIRGRTFRDLAEVQAAFDHFRDIYNQERPHQALDLATPMSRYHPSSRPYRATPEPFDYGAEVEVRRVDVTGRISWRGAIIAISDALAGEDVGIRPIQPEGTMEVIYRRTTLKRLPGPGRDQATACREC